MNAPLAPWARMVIGLTMTVLQSPGDTVWTPYTFVTLVSGGNSPSGVAVDRAGNIYVADVNNHSVLKGSSAGEWTILAGSAGNPGSADGTGRAARFNGPSSLAADGGGDFYVADYFNYTIRKITPKSVVTTLAG